MRILSFQYHQSGCINKLAFSELCSEVSSLVVHWTTGSLDLT